MRVTKLLGRRVLVEFPPDPVQSNGVYIPEAFRLKSPIGRIVMLGTDSPGMGQGLLAEVKVGDMVRVNRAFNSVAVNGNGTLRIVSILDILYVVPVGSAALCA